MKAGQSSKPQIQTFEPEDLKFQDQIRKEVSVNNIAFYEKIVSRLKLSPFPASVLIAIVTFWPHYFIASYYEVNIFTDFSFMVSMMIGINLYLVLIATKRLRKYVVNLVSLTNISVEEFRETFLPILNKTTKDYNLLPYGIGFGIINTLFGFLFGHWYTEIALSISLATLHFLVGFMAGMAAGGIVGVIRLVNQLDQVSSLTLNYFHPDKCAGTLLVGKIVFTFATYTLIMGFFIASYIFLTPWSNISNYAILEILTYFWIVFPFLVSLAVFAFPIFELHKILADYKRNKLLENSNKMMELVRKFESSDLSHEEIQQFGVLQENAKLSDSYLQTMNTWPYDLRYKATYLSVFLSLSLALIAEISTEFIVNLISKPILTP
ncbi:MAG: hypothetical protein ABFS32_17080 [Bacteroidota bacterium]